MNLYSSKTQSLNLSNQSVKLSFPMYIGGDDKTSNKKYILFLSGITISTSLPNNSHKSNS